MKLSNIYIEDKDNEIIPNKVSVRKDIFTHNEGNVNF